MADHAILTPEAHRNLRIATTRGPATGDAVMAAIAVPDEFRRLQNEYPILFQLDHERDSFTPVALFGFEAAENLYVDDTGWDARYLPLAIDIQPFLIGGVPGDVELKQVHIDMGHPRVGTSEGVRVFDDDGRPTPYLEQIIDKLGALDAGYAGIADFIAALRRHDLLEPFTLEVTLDDGSTNRLIGFHVIDEDRVRSLDAATLGELHAADHLLPIFMALASLANLTALIARRNARVRGG